MSRAKISQQNTTKPAKSNISGVLLLDKPYGITSNRALQIARRLFSAAKSGHTGTLDPMATGLLPICFGEATKFSSVLLGADKTYEAILKLGYTSSTGDAEGEIIKLNEIKADSMLLTLPYCESVLQRFIGKILQTPPMYSALKHQGKPLYIYARNGEVIERSPREVLIYNLRAKSLKKNELHISVRCGTGTYIRTLAEEIGKALGCGGAYLAKLCRSGIDRFDLSEAKTLKALEDMDPTYRKNYLHPVDSLLYNFPALVLDNAAASFLFQGRAVANQSDRVDLKDREKIRLYNQQNQFLGLGAMTAEGKIIPKRLLSSNPFPN